MARRTTELTALFKAQRLPGKNLFDKQTMSEGTLSTFIPVIPNATYSVSGVKTSDMNVYTYDSDKGRIGGLAIENGIGTFTTSATVHYIKLSYESSENVMLVVGSTLPKCYEPYIGTPEHYTIHNCKNGYFSDKEDFALKVVGKTEQNGTPTPDTPIPIQCVPKGTKVKVLGKNLCPPLSKGIRLNDTTGTEYAYANGAVSDKIPVNFSKTPYITVSGFIEIVRSCVFAYDKNGVFIGGTSNAPKTSQVLSSNSAFLNGNGTKEYDKIAYLRIEMYTDNTVTGTIDDIVNAKIQLEIGENATPYEPYTCQEITTPCDLYENDVWYPTLGRVEKRANCMALTGTEKWNELSHSDSVGEYKCFYTYANNMKSYHLSSLPIFFTHGTTQVYNGFSFTPFNGVCRIYDAYLIAPTISEWKDWLAEKNNADEPLKIVYELTTPQVEQFDPHPVYTPQGTVNIMQESTDLLADIQATVLVLRG